MASRYGSACLCLCLWVCEYFFFFGGGIQRLSARFRLTKKELNIYLGKRVWKKEGQAREISLVGPPFSIL